MWLPEALNSGLLALCGPNRVLDESTCDCVCRNGLTEDSCDPGWKLDHNTCKDSRFQLLNIFHITLLFVVVAAVVPPLIL